MKKFIKIIIICLVSVFISVLPSFADMIPRSLGAISPQATSGNFEYNDYSLYSTNGTLYSSGVFRSNDGTPLSSFVIQVNVNTNQWFITGGSWTDIPFPSDVEIDYQSNSHFLQSAYIMCNGTRYNFTIISGSDSSGIFYSQSIPASPYYYPVSVYLPTDGMSTGVPSTPTLSVTNQDNANYLTWQQTSYSAKILYSETGTGSYDVLSYNSRSPFKVTQTGYYRIQLNYNVDGQSYLTDTSNRVYTEAIDDSNTEGNDPSGWQKILQFFDNVLGGLERARINISSFTHEVGLLINDIFSWLPDDVLNVFWAIIVIGLILGLFIK